jgi:hypothetical protein
MCSNAGVIHEVTPDQVKVVEITTNPYLGYASWRPRPVRAGRRRGRVSGFAATPTFVPEHS